ncbi:MAG: hypothetical protein M0001_03805 [Treponema sp.]|nr:hypothetical protein [Treponema sp.]
MQTIDISMPRADVRWGAALGLLQAGFSLRAPAGMSARAFMREVLGFPDAYIEGAVSTVFIDDSPVDDIDAARLVEGSRIALSAAMPGLVGAVMRRHSPYAALRESISYREGEGGAGGGGGRVVGNDRAAGEGRGGGGGGGAAPAPEVRVGVKLFNSVMVDRGPEVLARGIYLEGQRAVEALRDLGLDGASPAVAELAVAVTTGTMAELFLRICEVFS